jgi:hypothetical protein
VTIVDKTAEPADVFAAHLARWEAAVADPDGTVERVARAIAASDGVDFDGYLADELSLVADYRANARAAIAALRPAPDAPRVDAGVELIQLTQEQIR